MARAPCPAGQQAGPSSHKTGLGIVPGLQYIHLAPCLKKNVDFLFIFYDATLSRLDAPHWHALQPASSLLTLRCSPPGYVKGIPQREFHGRVTRPRLVGKPAAELQYDVLPQGMAALRESTSPQAHDAGGDGEGGRHGTRTHGLFWSLGTGGRRMGRRVLEIIGLEEDLEEARGWVTMGRGTHDERGSRGSGGAGPFT